MVTVFDPELDLGGGVWHRRGGDARGNCGSSFLCDTPYLPRTSANAGGDSDMTFKKESLGTSLEDWLEEEGILQEATDSAAKKVMEWRAGEAGLAGEQKAKLSELRQIVDASIARGGSRSAQEVRAAVKARQD
jgi:hypothetical protein